MSEGTSASTRGARANRGFGIVVAFSVGLHALAIGSALYAQGRRPEIKPFQNAVPVQLVALGKKRDPKLLPRIQQEAPPPPPDEGIALETSKTDPSEKTKPSKKPEQKLSDAAKRMLEGANKDSKLDKALQQIEEREGQE